MRVQIVYTIDVTDEYRHAINAYHDKPGLATLGEVRQWHMTHGTSMDETLMTPPTEDPPPDANWEWVKRVRR